MGLQIHTSFFFDLLKQKNMSTAPFEKFKEAGVKFLVTQYTLQATDSHGEVLAKVSSPSVSVTKCLPQLAADLLTKLEAIKPVVTITGGVVISDNLKNALAEAKAKAPWNQGPAITMLTGNKPPPPAPAPVTYTAEEMLGENATAFSEPDPATTKGGYPVYDPKDPMPCLPLRQAIGLYRPVKGTDANSRYFLLADFGDLKMAGRWQGHKFSVRFEATDLSKYATLLKEVGVESAGQNHASSHLNVPKDMDARKLVFALIAAVGKTPKSPMPKVELIKGHGA